ncbi:EAL and HDOD domain-containing protein [Noviherbaspirillum sp. UKPF54]|uniref:EAL and HDOD domain-containing protein n=1 Tax=Noviherbaspirillum sp. UKPF54 TaxID=2601898 RepID=UPI0011B1C2F8|nr:EAL domain-containing protein [Noviherbaspirillum sp. UKPF54]QDZ30467.1 EAL domain-containing protein [Noviherbaspirillum sp. UKPF54]
MNDLVLRSFSQTPLPLHRAKEFFLARQPILDRNQDLVAYELLFRTGADGPADVTDDVYATASVIAHASELGLENVVGTLPGFVNVDAAVLMSDFIQFLPRDKVVLEVLETVEATDEIVARIDQLSKAGYVFALDDVVAESGSVRRLLPMARIVKIDISGMSESALRALSARFIQSGKKLLAEKVENLGQFHQCLELGFAYFQGYYFAKPFVLTGKKLSPSQMTIVRLMAQITENADSADLERSIKQDAALALPLLRLANAPAAGAAQGVDSIGHALAVLDKRQLHRWLQILLYAEPGKAVHAASPLLTLASTRGRLLELIAAKIRQGDRHAADVAFTVGTMSLMDALFGMPMEKILEQVSVSKDVRDALLVRQGFYGDLLRLAESVEQFREPEPAIAPLLRKLSLSGEDFYALQLAAYKWSNRVTDGAN